jgi:hypothetical protein
VNKSIKRYYKMVETCEKLICCNRILKFSERKVSNVREISIREISELNRSKVRPKQTVPPAINVKCSDIYLILFCHPCLNNCELRHRITLFL